MVYFYVGNAKRAICFSTLILRVFLMPTCCKFCTKNFGSNTTIRVGRDRCSVVTNNFGLILGHYAINITISISLSKALVISTHFHMTMFYCCLDDFYTILGSYFFGGYTAVKLSYTKVSTFKKTLLMLMLSYGSFLMYSIIFPN